MSLFAQVAPAACAPAPHPYIEVLEPPVDRCNAAPPPEGHVKLRNYRLVGDGLRAYTPTGDVHTSPSKRKLVARWECCADVSPPRNRILELVLPEQPGSDALEAIVRPALRPGLDRPLDDEACAYLQRALPSPSPSVPSEAATPEPTPPDLCQTAGLEATGPSLADELWEAEINEKLGNVTIRNVTEELQKDESVCAAAQRERLGRLALSVEQDDGEMEVAKGRRAGPAGERGTLSAAARRLDVLLAESRDLHHELAEIHRDMQVQEARADRCAARARALGEESRALRFLDDVVALLRGDLTGAVRARAWPFAFGGRTRDRNYIV